MLCDYTHWLSVYVEPHVCWVCLCNILSLLIFLSYNEAINCIVKVVYMACVLRSVLHKGLFIRLCTNV